MRNYDREALNKITLWKNPESSFLDKVIEPVNEKIQMVGDFILDNAVGEVVSTAVQGIVSTINDASAWSVRTDAIFEEFVEKGHRVQKITDIESLELCHVDKVVGFLGAKYKAAALVEGGAAGAAGAPGIAADIPLLFGLVLRAVGEYATYYGFDVESQVERKYMMDVLRLVSSPTQAAKQSTLLELSKIATAVAKKKTWDEIEKITLAKMMKKLGEQLGIRMTKAKLGQIVPVFGAVVGAGYNAYYTNCACEAAYHLYRERFLAREYGFEIKG